MIKRIFRHLLTSQLSIKKSFSKSDLSAIEQAIAESERQHTGEIVFLIEPALELDEVVKKIDPRTRALDMFSKFRVWDTELNNGVLLYLLLADRDIEIVADRGFNDKVSAEEWNAITKVMEDYFKEAQFGQGVLHGIRLITDTIKAHFPNDGGPNLNELPDTPELLY